MATGNACRLTPARIHERLILSTAPGDDLTTYGFSYSFLSLAPAPGATRPTNLITAPWANSPHGEGG
jgi:hypothetical protein